MLKLGTAVSCSNILAEADGKKKINENVLHKMT